MAREQARCAPRPEADPAVITGIITGHHARSAYLGRTRTIMVITRSSSPCSSTSTRTMTGISERALFRPPSVAGLGVNRSHR